MTGPYAGRSQIGSLLEHEDTLYTLFVKVIETCKILARVYEWTRLDPHDDSLVSTALGLDADVSLALFSVFLFSLPEKCLH